MPESGQIGGGEMSRFARLLQFSLILSFVIVAASATARPRPRAASGGFGAVALGNDIGCGGSIYAPARVFLSLNEPSREEAERRAITGCQGMGGAGCVVTRTIYPHQCYYIAVSSVADCRDAWSFGGGRQAPLGLSRYATRQLIPGRAPPLWVAATTDTVSATRNAAVRCADIAKTPHRT